MSFTWATLYSNTSLTRGEFITNLRIRIDEDLPTYITNTQLNSLINAGIQDVTRRVGFLKGYADQTATSATSYQLPSDLRKLDRVEYLGSDNKWKALVKLSRSEIDRNVAVSVTNYYIREGDYISLFSAPSSGTIRIYGSKMPTLPVTDSSYIDIPSQYIELLYAWMEWKYWVRRRSENDITMAYANFTEVLDSVTSDVEQEYSEGVTMYGNF